MKPGALIDGFSIDQEVAEETKCPECGTLMEFDPRNEDGEYQAWAVCPNEDCGHEFEF